MLARRRRRTRPHRRSVASPAAGCEAPAGKRRAAPLAPAPSRVGRQPFSTRRGTVPRGRMGWSFPWASSSGSDFNYDFNYDFQAASTPQQQQSGTGEYNFRPMDMRPSLEAGQEGRLPSGRLNAARTGRRTRGSAPVSARSRSTTASSTTPTRPTRAAWAACGACTSGWTGHREDETRHVPPAPPQPV